MKNTLYLLILFLLISTCDKAEQTKDGYAIAGTAKGVHNGIRVYLKTIDERGKQSNLDTAIIVNETFKFEGKTEAPGVHYFFVNGVAKSLPFILENADISVVVNKDSIYGSKVTGTKSNDLFKSYSAEILDLRRKNGNLNIELRQERALKQDAEVARITSELETLKAKMNTFPLATINKHNDNLFSLTLIASLIESKSIDFDKLVEAFNNLDSDLRASPFGTEVFNKLEFKKQKNASLAFLNIGKVAPKFSAPSTDGNTIVLDDILGKVTIIDFWASWCGPCRRENPNVVKTYEQYHAKGLEIISVSLDKPGQKNRWLDAIKKDNLNWHHVSNLNYFNDPVAQLYNIQSIPATFILDKDGKIVAKNLRGAALGQKIGELLN
ncbi:hypothetical protein A9Q87_12895 [Flavobacteriales bacterium 34_180_T64]|nr:hypothetical protein A9Q87_12895 [Flavobacteriales bacterium 34_180_T64]